MATVSSEISRATAGSIAPGESSDGRITPAEALLIVQRARDGTDGVDRTSEAAIRAAFEAAGQLALYESVRGGEVEHAGSAADTSASAASDARLRSIEGLITSVDGFNTSSAAASALVPDAATARREASTHLHAARDAAARGDWATAQRELAALGFPWPHDGSSVTDTQCNMAILLGEARVSGTSVSFPAIRPNLSMMEGFERHAALMARMQSLGVAPSEPPTDAQLQAFMTAVGRSGSSDDLIAASRLVSEGMLVHHGTLSAHAGDFTYGAATDRNYIVRDADGLYALDDDGHLRTFTRSGAADYMVEHEGAERVQVRTRTPETLADITAHRSAGVRTETDCEGYAYMWAHTLGSQPGWSTVGFMNLQPLRDDRPHGTGHTVCVLRSPDGHFYLCSNETITEIRPSPGHDSPTQADIENAATRATEGMFERGTVIARYTDTSSDPVVAQRMASVRAAADDDSVAFVP